MSPLVKFYRLCVQRDWFASRIISWKVDESSY